jgi:gluconokinase
MPPDLLASQFRTLEPPGHDEHPITISIEAPVDAIVDTIVRQLNPGAADRGASTGDRS